MTHDLDDLLAGLASEDPSVRDGWAYEELAEGIATGRFAGDVELIRETAVSRLGAPGIQARAFAPLVLAWLVHAGDRDRGAFEAVSDWYVAETDTRGHHPRLGWLHAVAHGADYLGACVETGIATGPEVLEVLARRIVTPGEPWRDQEDARVAVAAVQALSRCGATAPAEWLTVLNGALDAFERTAVTPEADARPPGWLHNVSSTCALLYVTLAEQPRHGEETLEVPSAKAVRTDLARILARMSPWLLAVRAG